MGTNITAFRLVDPNNPLVQEVVRWVLILYHCLPSGGSSQPSSTGGCCTDENIVFRCDSGKNSLVIISMF